MKEGDSQLFAQTIKSIQAWIRMLPYRKRFRQFKRRRIANLLAIFQCWQLFTESCKVCRLKTMAIFLKHWQESLSLYCDQALSSSTDAKVHRLPKTQKMFDTSGQIDFDVRNYFSKHWSFARWRSWVELLSRRRRLAVQKFKLWKCSKRNYARPPLWVGERLSRVLQIWHRWAQFQRCSRHGNTFLDCSTNVDFSESMACFLTYHESGTLKTNPHNICRRALIIRTFRRWAAFVGSCSGFQSKTAIACKFEQLPVLCVDILI